MTGQVSFTADVRSRDIYKYSINLLLVSVVRCLMCELRITFSRMRLWKYAARVEVSAFEDIERRITLTLWYCHTYTICAFWHKLLSSDAILLIFAIISVLWNEEGNDSWYAWLDSPEISEVVIQLLRTKVNNGTQPRELHIVLQRALSDTTRWRVFDVHQCRWRSSIMENSLSYQVANTESITRMCNGDKLTRCGRNASRVYMYLTWNTVPFRMPFLEHPSSLSANLWENDYYYYVKHEWRMRLAACKAVLLVVMSG